MESSLVLKDKVALITGSSRGIGWETARLFAQSGATVILNGLQDAEGLANRAKEIESEFGTPCIGKLMDVANAASVGQTYQEIFKEFGRLDILVNNAGILDDGLLGMISPATVERTFAINTFGALYNLQAASRLMARHKSGSIINLSSIIGTHGNEGQVVYSASKAALIGLTLSAAKELAPKNIRVNAVAPGYINTDMIKNLPPEKHAQRMASIKMARIGEPEDVAKVVLFLASELSSYVTGQVIGVDGGMLV